MDLSISRSILLYCSDVYRALQKRATIGFLLLWFCVAIFSMLGAHTANADSKFSYQGYRFSKIEDQKKVDLCLEFTAPLNAYEPFDERIRIKPTPSLDFVWEAKGRELCGNFAHVREYDVTLSADLRSVAGDSLGEDKTISLNTGLDGTSLSFDSHSYILPLDATPEVPIKVKNISSFDLVLYEVSARNLNSSSMKNYFLDSEIRDYNVQYFTRDLASAIWSKTITVNGYANQEINYSVPLDMLPEDSASGVYVLLAMDSEDREADRYPDWQMQWLVRTDIGLTTYLGKGGMLVSARSLSDATPAESITVTLLSRNNTVIDTLQTNAAGLATFKSQLVSGVAGMEPKFLLAEKGDDLSFLMLSRSPIDLSDRGIEGKNPQVGLGAYVYTDRGLYRRGDTIHTVALLRDENADAVNNFPVRVKVTRPDQVEVQNILLKPDDSGSFAFDYELPVSAPSGKWTIAFYQDDQTAKALGKTSVIIGDIIPPTIRITFDDLPKQLISTAKNKISFAVDYLFGAPAEGLEAKVELSMHPAKNPFPKFSQYAFGYTYGEKTRPLLAGDLKTKEGGKGFLEIGKRLLAENSPLMPSDVLLTVEVLETGGRAVSKQTRIPLRVERDWLGIRPLVEEADLNRWWRDDGRVAFPIDKAVEFSLQGVDPDGEAKKLESMSYKLVRQYYHYHWYVQNDEWHWQREIHDYEYDVTTGNIEYDDSGAASLQFADLRWGYYRLEIFDEKGTKQAASKFRIGWSGSELLSGIPDVVEIATDKSSYHAGESVTLNIKSPLSGEAQVLLMNPKVEDIKVLYEGKVQENEPFNVTLEANEEWLSGAYVVAQVYRPFSAKQGYIPDRAVGVHWIKKNIEDRVLDVNIQSPNRIHNRETLTVSVDVKNSVSDEVYVTLAAVDEGVLLLDDFENPSPLDHFFSKVSFAYELRDMYKYILDTLSGNPTDLAIGGDGKTSKKMMELMPENDIKIVSLFSGVVPLKNQKAEIEFEMPEFQGELRLMAVAWNETQLGVDNQSVKVSDPLVLHVTKPRFLAIGDQSEMTLQLFNLDRPSMSYVVTIEPEGSGVIFGGLTYSTTVLHADQKIVIPVALDAAKTGTEKFTLRVRSDDGYEIEQTHILGVRPPYTPISVSEIAEVPLSGSVTFLDTAIDDYMASTVSGNLVFQRTPTFGLLEQLNYLDGYPYGCLEQTTSKAFPLLYLDQLASLVGYKPYVDSKEGIASAVDRIFDRQRSDGSFGLWRSSDHTAIWASVYALDFLLHAKEQGHKVPDIKLQRALDWLSKFVLSSEKSDYTSAKLYGHYVLARAGYGGLEKARQRLSIYSDELRGSAEAGMLAATFAELGDRKTAEEAFKIAFKPYNGNYNNIVRRNNYGTNLRDAAMLLYFMKKYEFTEVDGHTLSDQILLVNSMTKSQRWLSTQTRNRLVLAVGLLRLDDENVSKNDNIIVRVNGKLKPFVIGKPVSILSEDLQDGITIEKSIKEPIWAEIQASGVTLSAPRVDSRGVQLTKRILDFDLKPVDPLSLEQGELYLISLTGTVTVPSHQRERKMLLVDYLPAGFEIENADVKNSAAALAENWLKLNDPTDYVEAMDDRYVASYSALYSSKYYGRDPIKLLYMVRAVSRGEYILPNTYAEDMVDPSVHGSTGVSRIIIR